MSKPSLRFSEFVNEWNQSNLSNHTKSISSGKSATLNIKNGKYKIYGSTGAIGLTDNAEYFGDRLLIARVGANAGAIYRVDGRYAVSDNTLIIDLKDSLNIVFAYNLLEKNSLKHLVFGSGQPLITGGQLKKLQIILPTVAEQQKIADFLTIVDEKIISIDKKNELLKLYKKSVMQKIFTQQIRLKDHIGDSPIDWEDKKLSELVKFYRGNSLSKADLNENGKFKAIHYGELFTEYVEVIQNIKSRTDISTGAVSQLGDILMPTSDVTPQGLAKASVIEEDGVMLGGDINILRPNDLVNPIFLSYIMNFQKKKIMRLVSGSTVRHVYSKDIAGISYTIPKQLEEQEKIANFLTIIDSKIAIEKDRLNTAKKFRQVLLQRMFV